MLYATNNPNTLKAIVGEELTKDFYIILYDANNSSRRCNKRKLYTNQDFKMDYIGRQLATWYQD